MVAMPGHYALHARAVAEAYERQARLAAQRPKPAPPQRVVEVEARDLREGDVIVLESGTPVHTVHAVEAQPRKNLARIWTATGQVITYSGLVLITRPTTMEA